MGNDNTIKIGEEIYAIKPVKMKYIKNNFLFQYACLQENGFIKTMKYSDGKDIIQGFINAVIDNEELSKKAFEDLDTISMKEILDITKKINEIEDPEKNVETPTDKN